MQDNPPLDPDIGRLREFFANDDPRSELRNPHPESPVPRSVRENARPAAVLVPVIDAEAPRVVVTRRHAGIRFAGHVCFPGGTADPLDRSAITTALRETEEEIGVPASAVEVLGCLGDYYTQTGYRITPVVGLLASDMSFRPNPREVDAIFDICLGRMLDPRNYTLTWRTEGRGHYSFHEGEIRIAGPTVSLMIGLYETLARWTNT